LQGDDGEDRVVATWGWTLMLRVFRFLIPPFARLMERRDNLLSQMDAAVEAARADRLGDTSDANGGSKQ
jgi:hypothetical protein